MSREDLWFLVGIVVGFTAATLLIGDLSRKTVEPCAQAITEQRATIDSLRAELTIARRDLELDRGAVPLRDSLAVVTAK